MIPQDTINLILDTARIEEVVGDFVSLKRRGASYVACCPFHNEKTPSFYVTPSKGIFKCFGCGKSGSAVGFVMEHESCTYPDALKYLARRYNIDIVEEELSAEQIAARGRNESLTLVSEFAHKFFISQLSTPEGKSIAMQYCHSRGLEDATIEKAGLGWAPSGGRVLVDAALAAGYKEQILLDAGVATKKEDGTITDKFRARVMFPIKTVSGRVVAFSGRTLKADNPAKYVNTADTEIYKKSRNLLGIYDAKSEISRQDKCFLVEGNVDVITLQQLGIQNVVASCGTSLTEEQIRLIRKFTPNLTIMYDGDKAGIHAAIRGINMVLAEGMNVRIVLLPEGEDPDSFGRTHTLDQVREYIAANEVDFVSFKTDLLLEDAAGDAYKKSGLINDIADTIAQIPDPVQRTVYAEATATKFGIEASVIFGRINKTLLQQREDRKKEKQRAALREQSDIPPFPDSEPMAAEVEPQYVEEDHTVAAAEKDLLHFLLTYGDEKLVFESDSPYFSVSSPDLTVRDFILSALDEPFRNSCYGKVLKAYSDAASVLGQAAAVRGLLDGEDRMVSQIAASLYAEKYILTVKDLKASMMTTQSWLARYVPKTVIYYAERRVQSRIDGIMKDLRTASSEQQTALMADFIQLKKVQQEIKKKYEEF